MHRDPQNDGKKCGTVGSDFRTFKLTKEDAQESKCKKKCAEQKDCVAMSGKWHDFCIGCKVELNNSQFGTKAFRKLEKGKIRIY